MSEYRRKGGYSTAMEMGQTVFSVISSLSMSSQTLDHLQSEGLKLRDVYESNVKSLAEAYETNWYRENFKHVQNLKQISDYYAAQESEVVGQLGIYEGVASVAGSSYYQDIKSSLDTDLEDYKHTMVVERSEQVKDANYQFLETHKALERDLNNQFSQLNRQGEVALNQAENAMIGGILQLAQSGGEYMIGKSYAEPKKTASTATPSRVAEIDSNVFKSYNFDRRRWG